MAIDYLKHFMVDSPKGGVDMTGTDLKKYRVRKNFTQKQLGLLLGYNEKSAERTVQHWELDARPIPVKHYRALSKILGVPLEKFIP